MSPVAKLTKEEAGYIDPPSEDLWPRRGQGIRCGTCIFSELPKELRGKPMEVLGACEVVAGEIASQGCCNLYDYTEEDPVPLRWMNGPDSQKRLDELAGDDSDEEEPE